MQSDRTPEYTRASNIAKNNPNRCMGQTTDAEELARLKLELAQTRARTDSIRLQARNLISQRTTLRESAAKTHAETEEQRLILTETMKSIDKLQKKLKSAEEEGASLREKLRENKGNNE